MSDAAGAPAPQDLRTPLIERAAGAIAVTGGTLSLAVALLVVVSVIGRRFFDAPIPGDFELVQMATAVAVFSFLPYCQARRGNIVVDTFTTRLPARVNAVIDAFWDLVYAGMMGLITVCLVVGTLDHISNGQTTMVLQVPIWPAIAICTGLALLLTGVALATGARLLRGRA
jgi:TRAP-type C4-dicarboxylate transport system permease small subunit